MLVTPNNQAMINGKNLWMLIMMSDSSAAITQ